MKSLLAVLVLVTSVAWAEDVVLTWEDTKNPPETTYNVYRGDGPCSVNTQFGQIASGIAVKAYTNTGVLPGTYCYAATAMVNGVESPQSNEREVTVKPAPPENFAL